MIALDSNVIIDTLRGKYPVRRRLMEAKSMGLPMAVSCLALEEVMVGVHRRPDGSRAEGALRTYLVGVDIVPFEEADALLASSVRAGMETSGVKAPRIDFLIGAHALARGHTLVTANTRDFRNIPGLRLLDWTQAPEAQQEQANV